jgi:hypothetical protein
MTADEALTEFTLFPNFPMELQIKIWKQAIPPPHLVRVNVQGDIDHIRLSTNTSVPALLRASKTSRDTILRVYKTSLESGDRKIRTDGNNDILVHFGKGLGGYYTNVLWVDYQKMD